MVCCEDTGKHTREPYGKDHGHPVDLCPSSTYPQETSRPKEVITVDILGLPLSELLDSGSARPIVGSKGMQIVHASGLKMMPSAFYTLKVANKGSCLILGQYEVPFDVANIVRLVTVLYAP